MSYEAAQTSLIPAGRNALAPRGGLAFDGTASNRAYALLPNQNIGTDAFSVSVVFRVPTTAPTNSPALVGLSTDNGNIYDDPNLWISAINGSGGLDTSFSTLFSTNYRTATVAGVVAAYGGKVVHVVFTRTGTTFKIYINGVDTAYTSSTSGVDPTYAMSVTSTNLVIGSQGSSNSSNFTFYALSLYNLALAQADVTEIYGLGGAVPERFKFGSQQAIANVARNSAFLEATSDWGHWNTGSVSISGGKLVSTNSVNDGGPFIGLNTISLSTGANANGVKRWIPITVQYDLSGFTGSGDVRCALFSGTAAQQNVSQGSMADGTYTAAFNIQAENLRSLYLGFLSYGSGTRTFSIDNVIVKVGSAICHYDADLDGVGYQLHDQSTNKLDAIVTTTGASWTKAARRGYIRQPLTWAGTHEAKILDASLPPSAVVTLLTVFSSAATTGSGVAFGRNGDTNYWSGATVMGANVKQNRALVNTIPFSSSHYPIFVDPDTNDYTGTITPEVHYVITEGTP